MANWFIIYSSTAPTPKPAKGGWYNVNFALVPTVDTKIDIVKYNNTTQPAQPGDTVNIDLSGSQLSPLPTHIEWRDSNGNVVQKQMTLLHILMVNKRYIRGT